MSKRLSDVQLRQSLHVDHFGMDDGPLTPSDPMTKTPMVLRIDEIELYNHNPRRARNEKYEELKDSIRVQGLKQPLVVTRRPGMAKYMLKYGGNTRLTILQELLAETSDAAAFGAAPCLFEPWTTEADVLVGHLVENETRGDLIFIDKAHALRAVKQLIEEENGSAVSMRQLAEILRHKGYRISASIISYCEYAVSVLADAIPQVLNAGMGRPQIERLRLLDHAAHRVWTAHALGDDAIYRAVFCEALAELDGPAWAFDQARRAIESALADRAGLEPRYISLELGGELETPAAEGDEAPARSTGANMDVGTATPSAPQHAVTPATKAPPGSGIPLFDTASDRTSPPPSKNHTPLLAHPRAEPSSPPMPADIIEISAPDRVHARLRLLRDDLRTRAQAYAARVGLSHCVRVEGSPWIRLGYIVADWPVFAPPDGNQSEPLTPEALSWSWFELTRCCDLLPIAGQVEHRHAGDPTAKEHNFSELFGPHAEFLRAWKTPESFAQALDQTLGGFDLQQFASYAEQITDDSWQAGIHLMQAYRDLKVFARAAEIDLMQYDFGDGTP